MSSLGSAERNRPSPQGAKGLSDAGPLLRRLDEAVRLEPRGERALIERARRGDASARAELVERLLPLISATARTYRSSATIHHTELLQEGVVGVLRALERFEPERGVPFWAYASHWVRQAMQQLVSELTRPAVLSDRALRHLARLKEAHHEAVQHQGREPTADELAERSGLERAQVDDLLAVDHAPRSLDEPLPGTEVGSFGELLADPLAKNAYEDVLDAIQQGELLRVLSGLSDREQAILRARFGLDDGEEQSLRDIGDRLGLSAERVRQLERRALGKLAAASDVPA